MSLSEREGRRYAYGGIGFKSIKNHLSISFYTYILSFRTMHFLLIVNVILFNTECQLFSVRYWIGHLHWQVGKKFNFNKFLFSL